MLRKKLWLGTRQIEYIVPLLTVTSLLTSCIIVSSKKYFWNDELFSYYLLHDHSFTHMFSALNDRINTVPPLYFVLGWFWDKLFGSTELSLRLYSSLATAISCVTVWFLLRRTYTFWPTSVGTLSVFCISSLILYQNAEARMYGLFFATCALGMLLFDLINRKLHHPKYLILLNSVVHAFIVQTHLFGILYSFAMLLAFSIRDRYFRIFRLKIYLSIIISWLSLIFYIPIFINQADASNPRSWYGPPEPSDLLMNLLITPYNSLLFVFLMLILISGLQLIEKQGVSQVGSLNTGGNSPNFNSKMSLLILAATFLAVPVFVWCFSHAIKPVYWYRYMLPSTLSWSIFMAYVSSRLLSPVQQLSETASSWREILRPLSRAFIPVLLTILIIFLLLRPIRYAKSLPKEELPGSYDSTFGYRELPIVTQISHDFVKRIHYSPDRARYFFILDWQAAVVEASGRFAPGEYKNLEALKRNYPEVFQDNVLPSDDFLNKYKRFLVLDYLQYNKKCNPKDFYCPQWLEMRILSDSRYKVSELGNIKVSTLPDDIQDRKLLLVENQAVK